METAATHASKALLQLEQRGLTSPPELLSIFKAKQDTRRQPCGTSSIPSYGMQPLGENTVLSRVKAFLPVLDEANRKLTMAIQEKGADDFDIEAFGGAERGSYIEMDLAIGVADLHTPEAVAAAERAVGGQISNVLPSRDECDTDTESESAVRLNEEEDVQINDHEDVPAKRCKRPKIEQL